MNIENIKLLIDTLQNDRLIVESDVGFNMQYYHARSTSHTDDKTGHDCGTVACIAGHASLIASGGTSHAPSHARHFLGLTHEQANSLFIPDFTDGLRVRWVSITLEQALLTLAKLRDTGKVDWSHTGDGS